MYAMQKFIVAALRVPGSTGIPLDQLRGWLNQVQGCFSGETVSDSFWLGPPYVRPCSLSTPAFAVVLKKIKFKVFSWTFKDSDINVEGLSPMLLLCQCSLSKASISPCASPLFN